MEFPKNSKKRQKVTPAREKELESEIEWLEKKTNDPEVKKKLRRLRNKKCARESRKKKKQMIEELRRENEALVQKIKELEECIKNLKNNSL